MYTDNNVTTYHNSNPKIKADLTSTNMQTHIQKYFTYVSVSINDLQRQKTRLQQGKKQKHTAAMAS